jgi:hypothetical protein
MITLEFVAEHIKRLKEIEGCKALPVVMRVDAHLKLKVELQGAGRASGAVVEVIVSEVAKSLGVTEKPVRDALRLLADQRLLEPVAQEEWKGIDRKRTYRIPMFGAGVGGIARMREEGGNPQPKPRRKRPTQDEIKLRIKEAVETDEQIRREHANQPQEEAA